MPRRTLPLWSGSLLNTVSGQPPALMAMMDPLVYIRLCVPREEGVEEILARVPPDGRTPDDHGELDRHAMPHLVVEPGSGRVLEHDGRHRCAMVARAGGHVVPVAIRFRAPSVFALHWMTLRPQVEHCQQDFAWPEQAVKRLRELQVQGAILVQEERRDGPMLPGNRMPDVLLGQYDAGYSTSTVGWTVVKPRLPTNAPSEL